MTIRSPLLFITARSGSRTEYNPSGLLVADYWEQQMVGDKNTGLSQPDELSREATDKGR